MCNLRNLSLSVKNSSNFPILIKIIETESGFKLIYEYQNLNQK